MICLTKENLNECRTVYLHVTKTLFWGKNYLTVLQEYDFKTNKT